MNRPRAVSPVGLIVLALVGGWIGTEASAAAAEASAQPPGCAAMPGFSPGGGATEALGAPAPLEASRLEPSQGAMPDGPLTAGEAVRRAVESSGAVRRAELALRAAELRLRELDVRVASTATPLERADARQAYREALDRVRSAKVEAALEAELLYYAALRDERGLSFRRDATARAHRRLDVARRRHRSGRTSEIELRQAEQRAERAALEERAAEQRLRLARLRLSEATALDADVELDLGALPRSIRPEAHWPEHVGAGGVSSKSDEQRQADQDVDPGELGVEEARLDAERAFAAAMECRLDVRAAERALRVRERDVRLADNSYTPKAELERAEIARAQAELELDGVREQVRSEVWRAVFELEDARGRLRLAEGDLELAVADIDVAERRYANGRSALTDVLGAEARLAEAEAAVVSAVYDVRAARAAFVKALGIGLERWSGLWPAATGKGEGA